MPTHPFELQEFLGKTFIARLSDGHQTILFDCGHKDLNDFIVKEALVFQKLLHSVTYVLEYNHQIVAYYSLQKDKFKISPNTAREFKSVLRKQTKTNKQVFYQFLDMEEFPALKITRFAVHKDFQRKGIGTFLLDAITFPLLNQNAEGCMFVTVDSINNKDTINFYLKNGFQILNASVRKDSVLMYKNLIELA